MKIFKFLFLFLVAGIYSFQSYAQFQVSTSGYIGIGTSSFNARFKVVGATGQPAVYSQLFNTYNAFNPTIDYAYNALLNHYSTRAYGVSYGGQSTFYVLGSGSIRALNAYYYSDSTLKTNIEPITNALTKINGLNGYTFNYAPGTFAAASDSGHSGAATTYYGFLAQQVLRVQPSMVQKDTNGILAVAYDHVIPLLVEGVKALQGEIATIDEGLGCSDKSYFTPGGCAEFVKGDALNVTARYLEVKTDPASDSRREWIDSSDKKTLKYWDGESTPVKQTVEIKSNKNVANGYAGLDGSGKLTGSQQSYGTSSTTACVGNDSRLSDSRSGKLNFYSNATSTLPATASETSFAAILIPGNTLGSNDMIEVTVSGEMTNNANVKTYRMYLNTTASIGGTQMAIKTITSNAAFSGDCRIMMKNSSSSEYVNGLNAAWDATGVSTASSVTASLPSTSDIWIVLTGQKSNTTDTQSLTGYQIRIIKP